MKLYLRDFLAVVLLTALVCVQYVFLVRVSLIIPISWKREFIRRDCFRSDKGGKLANTRRDCMEGQGMFCTAEEPCTPCPTGGASDTNGDWSGSCKNCTAPFRKSSFCSQREGTAICATPGHRATFTCKDCCTRRWNVSRLIPAQPTIDPGSGTVTTSVTVTLEGPFEAASVYYTTDNTIPKPALMNGQWYAQPFVVDFAGADKTITVRAITVYYGLASNQTIVTYSMENCSTTWDLVMSSIYRTGGMNNTREALEDGQWQITGAGTLGGDNQYISAQFHHRVIVHSVRVSVYIRDRWDASNLAPAQLQYKIGGYGTNDTEEKGGRWITLVNTTDVPDVGFRDYAVTPPVASQALRLFILHGYLATGTLQFNVTACA